MSNKLSTNVFILFALLSISFILSGYAHAQDAATTSNIISSDLFKHQAPLADLPVQECDLDQPATTTQALCKTDNGGVTPATFCHGKPAAPQNPFCKSYIHVAGCPTLNLSDIINAEQRGACYYIDGPCGPPKPPPANCYAARTNPGTAHFAIDAWGVCRFIDDVDKTNQSFFVPFKSADEWYAFISNYPKDSLQLAPCVRPGFVAISANGPADENICLDPNGEPLSASINVPVPNYTRVGQSQTVPTTNLGFTCTVKGKCNTEVPPKCGPDQSWTKVLSSLVVTGQAAPDQADWQTLTPPLNSNFSFVVTYSGESPTPNDPPVTAACGTINGTATTMMPTQNLCAGGIPSPVTGNNPWSWTCQGWNTVSCSTICPAASGVCGTQPGACVFGNSQNLAYINQVLSAGRMNRMATWQCTAPCGGPAANCSGQAP